MGKAITVNLELTNLDQLIFISKTLLISFL